jgi:eukaryotic-like serine/threonine-protein kinase
MQFEQLGPYRLGKKLGQGGMGAVYEGVDSESGESAAIKVLSPRLAVDDGFRVRFEAEIESLKKLRHPNIVRLYGYGEEGGTLFYSMELVHGNSLEDELRDGRRFEWREVTRIAIKLCRALKHAHDHGVIHRDLKPANLLLTPEGEVKLSDFGIARLFGNTRLTADGGVLGTAEFMAPEQADGRQVTDRCDQYSLGGVMYALLSGRPPFRAKTLVEMLQLQRYAEPEPVTRYAPQTPAELARIIHQLLEKDPQKRFANTLILARSLEAMERGLSVSASRHDEDFVLMPPQGSSAGTSPRVPLAPTLSPTQLAAAQQEDDEQQTGQATAATMAYAEAAQRAALRSSELSEASSPRFTKVEEQRQDSSSFRDLLAGALAPQTLGLLAALVLLIAAGWYLMRPEGADALFGRIEAAASAGDVESLKSARRDMNTFLERFPQDPRAEQVQAFVDEAQQSSPIQRAYSEALRYALVNPERALARFQALIDVYDDGQQNSEATGHYIKLARLQRTQLQKRVARYVEDGRKLLAARLEKAAVLTTDNPPAACKMYEGIVELYRDKPWAADLVAQAQEALNRSTPRQAAAE